MSHSNRRMNNKGMSLVELLIAITILAIITVPLLHAFVSSARINRKAKQTQRLTTMGQDIMEGLKAYSVEDLAYEFDYPSVSSCSAHPSGFQLIKPSLVGTNATEVAARVKELVSTGTDEYAATTASTQAIKVTGVAPNFNYEFDKEATKNKTFYFAVTNVSSEESSSNSYKADILIKVDPKKYKDPTNGGSIANAGAQHNDKSLADLYSMDTSRDAFFIESGTQMNNAYSELVADGAVISSAEDISKDIEVNVSNDLSGNVKVVYKFIYKAKKADLTEVTAEYPGSLALNTLKYAELDNVYLFYMPTYGATGDKITYTNTTSEDLTFTLVKRQIAETDGVMIPAATVYKVDDPTILNNKESTYKCTVNINDTGNHTTLRTNVDTNLAKLINTADGDHVFDTSLSLVHIYPVTFTKKENVAGIKQEDRIFDVTIDIYEAGTIDDALSTPGTPLPADKHLVTVKGNMN